MAPIALAASVAAVVVLASRPGDVRTKGGLVFEVFRERGGAVARASSGDTFHPGDRLEFMVSHDGPREVMVVGREASGALYAAYPADGSKRSRSTRGGKRELLPGAVELDEAIGKEALFLVACPSPFTMDDLKPDAEAIAIPESCASASFVLVKEPRR